ncbi:MAG: mechanosensitive ion channel family protein [Acidobacteriota bacterium]
MQNNFTLYGNNLQELAIAAMLAAGLLLAVAGPLALIRYRLRKAAETETDTDDFLLSLANRTRLLLLLAPAVFIAARTLNLPPGLMSTLSVLMRLSLVAQGALWTIEIVDFFLRRRERRRVETDPSAVTTVRAFRFSALIAVWLVAILLALDNLGFNITALVTGLGIGGVAIALALQNILSDLFASLSIVLDKPFVVGDFIVVDSDAGTVELIGLKTTRLRSLTGEQLIFSNGDLVQKRIRNYKRMEQRRVICRFGVLYQTSAEVLGRIPLLLRGIVEAEPRARFDRAHFAAFGDSSYDFETVWYVQSRDFNVHMDVQQAINLKIVQAFEKESIEFAYPTRTLFIESPQPE